MKQRFLLWSVLAVMMAVGFSSCLKSNDTPPAAQTYIFLMHLGPQLPAVDLYFNDNKVSTSPFGFGSVSGTYAASQPGTFAVKFKKGDGDSLIASLPAAVYDTSRPYTLIVYNDDLGHGQAARIDDDFTNASKEKANFRFFHMSPDAGDVDFYIGDTKVEPFRQLADNVGGGSYYNDFRIYEPGNYKLSVKEAGTTTVLAETSSEASLAKGYVYTFFLKGLKTGTGTNALAIGIVQN